MDTTPTSQPLNPPQTWRRWSGGDGEVGAEAKQGLNVKIMQNSKVFYLGITLWNKYVDTGVCVFVCVCCPC